MDTRDLLLLPSKFYHKECLETLMLSSNYKIFLLWVINYDHYNNLNISLEKSEDLHN